jgi:hypothetical protein
MAIEAEIMVDLKDVVRAYVQLTEDEKNNTKIVAELSAGIAEDYDFRRGPDGNKYLGKVATLTWEKAAKIKAWRAADFTHPKKERGFQRELRASKVLGILRKLLDDRYAFAPIFVAAVKDASGEFTLWIVDGQHRCAAFVLARLPILAFVVEMDLETARHNFILHNARQTKTDRKTERGGSRNPVAKVIQEIGRAHV